MEENRFYLYIDGKPVKVSREVYQEYYRGERKERYFMQDLKRGKTAIDSVKQIVEFVPGREDSYERLLESGSDFASPGDSLEEHMVRSVLLEQALGSLLPEEQDVLKELYFLGKTEREAGVTLHMAKTTLRRKRDQALDKLRSILGGNF